MKFQILSFSFSEFFERILPLKLRDFSENLLDKIQMKSRIIFDRVNSLEGKIIKNKIINSNHILNFLYNNNNRIIIYEMMEGVNRDKLSDHSSWRIICNNGNKIDKI